MENNGPTKYRKGILPETGLGKNGLGKNGPGKNGPEKTVRGDYWISSRIGNKKPSYCWDSQPFVAIFRT